MAVSCPEVMYGAYYPYLYGRGAARSFHHAPHFQYERLNVQSNEPYGAAAASSGSASSGAHSPGSPAHAHVHALPPPAAPRHAKEEEHSRASNDGGGSSESEGECAAAACGAPPRARAQYVSANCVVFTHYSGDVAAVVDDHFARALAQDKHKESVPMVSRNLPASFFNAALCGAGAGAGGGACAGGVELYEYDPWHQHYGGYGRSAAEYHAAAAAQAAAQAAQQAHHSMAAAGYPGLLLPRAALHAQYKPVDWQHAPHAHLDPAACAPYSYPAVPGLEGQVQDTSKDLYWF